MNFENSGLQEKFHTLIMEKNVSVGHTSHLFHVPYKRTNYITRPFDQIRSKLKYELK